MHQNQRQNPRAPRQTAQPVPARGLIVFGRWALVAAGIVAIALGFIAASAAVRLVAFAGLSFLLANALWQHMPLARSCVAAGGLALLFGAAVALYRLFTWNMGLDSWLPDAVGALVGAAIAYPALKRIDRHSPSGQ